MKEPIQIKFTVLGVAQPQGSASAFIPKGWSRPVVTSANPKLKVWRKVASLSAAVAMRGTEPAGRKVPIRVEAIFYFERPKSVNKLAEKTTAPDLDKLARGLLDAFTGILYEDDASVTELRCSKAFGSPARVEVVVQEALPPQVRMARLPEGKALPF